MTTKRGLGRGLDALFEDEEATFAAAGKADEGGSPASTPSNSGPRRTLGIGQLTPNPDQPRTHFDPEAINELAGSIKQHGLLQPILVRPLQGSSDMFEIVAGERRWRACQKAQLHEVPVVIRDLDDSQTLQIALIENLQRRDLNAIEEAKGYQRLMDDFGFSAEDIGQAVNKSRSHVANLTRLLQLPQTVQAYVLEGKISAGHARAVIGADNPALLAQEIISRGLSVRQTEEMAASNAGRTIQTRARKDKPLPRYKDPDLLAMETDLSNALGMKLTIEPDDFGAGVVRIAYRTLDQFDDLALRLAKIPKVIEIPVEKE